MEDEQSHEARPIHYSPITIHKGKAAARLAWLDLFRGTAVVAMIEAHVVNTFLAAPLRASAWFPWLHYANGLVAPAFLFIAGYAQGLGMRRSTGAPRGVAGKFRRLAGVALLGYALHFPAPQIFAGQWTEALRLWTQVDILQCLAVSLALLLAAERWLHRAADVVAVVALALAVIAAEPAAGWRLSPEWLRAYISTGTGSLFPLPPWMGFVCAGFLASAVGQWRSWRWAAAWALLVALAFLLPGSVGFFLARLAWLLAAVPLVMWLAEHWQPRGLLFAGRESLVMYAAHLLLLEALAALFVARSSLGLAGCALVFPAILTVTCLIACGWRRLRDHPPSVAT